MKLDDILRSNLKRYSKKSSGWIETFCPFCNDETRKSNPSHGHLYISPDLNYFLCFRCNISGSIVKLLNKIGITGLDIKNRKLDFLYDNIRSESDDTLSKVVHITKKFIDKYGKDSYKRFIKYLNHRSYKINHFKYFIVPVMVNNIIGCAFFNHDGIHVTTRMIEGNLRYLSPKHNYKKYYYFTDTIYNIIEYKNIVICEGAFDAINLKRFIFTDRDYFFISIQNSFFNQAIHYLIGKYLKYYNYTIHVVFDSDKVHDIVVRKPNIKVKMYKPVMTKDVSDLCFIEELK
ncbi:MAG: hypothetical protein QXD03_03115 [Candidatus Anstonellales archaeon]